MMEAVQKSFSVLSEIDTILYDETISVVTDLVYFQSDQTTSGSSFNCLGLIGMNSITDEQNWTTALEMIVHEAAHQIVYNIMADELLILNEDVGKFKSSLRSDPRPLSGIFHAMVVLSRMIYVMSKLTHSEQFREEGIQIIPARNNARNIDSYHNKYFAVLEVIERNANLSKTGWEMVESSKKLASMKIDSDYIGIS